MRIPTPLQSSSWFLLTLAMLSALWMLGYLGEVRSSPSMRHQRHLQEPVGVFGAVDSYLMQQNPEFLIEEWHGDTTTAYANGDISIASPSTDPADTLFLFLSRTDAALPMVLDGWTRGAECFKSNNNQQQCWVASDCLEFDGPYCDDFPSGGGSDLLTIVFFRQAELAQATYTVELSGSHAAWAILTAIKGVDPVNPVRYVATESCDGSSESVFPSIADGIKDDILLLSMAFDDSKSSSRFEAPYGTELLGYESGWDETGVLFGTKLRVDGPTGALTTEGSGGISCKDALISMTLRPAVYG